MQFTKLTLAWILVWTGIGILSYSGWQVTNKYFQVSAKSQQEAVMGARVRDKVPVEIELPKLNLKVGIVPGQVIDGQWQVAETKANYLVGSGVLGEPGNVVIYAHKKPQLFGRLTKLSTGDRVIVRSSEIVGEYEIVDSQLVPPDTVEILADSNEKLLTLYTCNGWKDEDRLVLQAKYVRERKVDLVELLSGQSL